MERSSTMTVQEVAQLLHLKPETVRIGIETGALPFGAVIKHKRKVYVIYRDRFEQVTGIKTETN